MNEELKRESELAAHALDKLSYRATARTIRDLLAECERLSRELVFAEARIVWSEARIAELTKGASHE